MAIVSFQCSHKVNTIDSSFFIFGQCFCDCFEVSSFGKFSRSFVLDSVLEIDKDFVDLEISGDSRVDDDSSLDFLTDDVVDFCEFVYIADVIFSESDDSPIVEPTSRESPQMEVNMDESPVVDNSELLDTGLVNGGNGLVAAGDEDVGFELHVNVAVVLRLDQVVDNEFSVHIEDLDGGCTVQLPVDSVVKHIQENDGGVPYLTQCVAEHSDQQLLEVVLLNFVPADDEVLNEGLNFVQHLLHFFLHLQIALLAFVFPLSESRQPLSVLLVDFLVQLQFYALIANFLELVGVVRIVRRNHFFALFSLFQKVETCMVQTQVSFVVDFIR